MADETQKPDDGISDEDRALDEELAQMLAARQVEASKTERARKKNQVEYMKLEDRFLSELGGPLGQAFEIVDATANGEGFIVVKRASGIAFKRWRAATLNPKSDAEAENYNFVAPHVVHPTKEEFTALHARRAQLTHRCSDALVALHGAYQEGALGKH